MNAEHFSLKARRTTRIPLRIPIQLVLEEGGQVHTLDAWTMIVNIHGARVECKRRIELYQEIVIQIPFNGMARKGIVVWSNQKANESGNFEFGVELNEPGNLWGVGFPPSDWERDRAAERATQTPSQSSQAETTPEGSNEVPRYTADREAPVRPAPEEPAAISLEEPAVPPKRAALQVVDLSTELLLLSAGTKSADCSASPDDSSHIEPPRLEEETNMPIPDQAPEAGPAPHTVLGSDPAAAEPESLPLAEPAPGFSTDPAGMAGGAHPPRGSLSASDRLSALLNELVDSAVHDRVAGLVERLAQQVEARIGAIEIDALARVEERIQSAVASQSESMEQRTADFVAAQQKALEQSVAQLLAVSETGASERQRELMDQSKQAMRDEMAGLLQWGKERMEQQTSDLLLAGQQGLRSSMLQQLPAIERDLLDRCQTQAERRMAGLVEQWTLLFSDRVQQAQQSIAQRLNQTAEEVGADRSSAMEARIEEMLSQSGTRLEQQLTRIGTQVRQAFLRHIVAELTRSQQVWIQQAERQRETLATEHLERTRQSIAQLMRIFGESLIRQAYLPVQTPSPAAAPSEPAGETTAHENLSPVPLDPSC